MNWNESFGKEHMPTNEEVLQFLGKAEPLWSWLVRTIETVYRVMPRLEHSTCSGQPGWNIKYKKSGKSLCTLYPMQDYFIALVVIGTKEENEVQLAARSGVFGNTVRELYENTRFSAMGKWLMIPVKEQEEAEDVLKLIEIRMKTG